jgi:hypothetical protein
MFNFTEQVETLHQAAVKFTTSIANLPPLTLHTLRMWAADNRYHAEENPDFNALIGDHFESIADVLNELPPSLRDAGRIVACLQAFSRNQPPTAQLSFGTVVGCVEPFAPWGLGRVSMIRLLQSDNLCNGQEMLELMAGLVVCASNFKVVPDWSLLLLDLSAWKRDVTIRERWYRDYKATTQYSELESFDDLRPQRTPKGFFQTRQFGRA